ncbi:MAG: hypothetical protein ACREQJ_12165 [Candidatus Binatia bacterium]
MHESYLRHRNGLYLKLALIALAASIVAYVATRPVGGGNGGTPTGYALGGVSAALVVWLMWLGIRKRTYQAGGVMLREWLSGHVYFGLLLLALVPLHAGFQFGWNVHTLAYALMCVVIVSGAVGVGLYGAVPSQITENRSGEKLASLMEGVETLDADCRAAVASLPDTFAQAVSESIEGTRIGGSITQQLRGRSSATRFALARVRAAALEGDPADREQVRKLVGLLALKQEMIERIERDVRLKALLDLWLLIHIPVAFATVAAVVAHVWIVFFYR